MYQRSVLLQDWALPCCVDEPRFPFSFSLNGSLNYWHLFVIMNNAAVNTVHEYLFKTPLSVPLGTYLEEEILDHMVILFLLLYGTVILFPIAAVPFYITANLYSHQWCTRLS